jgi:hypothetical protein
VLHEDAVNCDTYETSPSLSVPSASLDARNSEGDRTAAAAIAAELGKDFSRAAEPCEDAACDLRLSLRLPVLLAKRSSAGKDCGRARTPRSSTGGSKSAALADLFDPVL